MTDALKRVALGLKLNFWGIMLVLVALTMAILGIWLFTFVEAALVPPMAVIDVLSVIVAGLLIIAQLMSLVGLFLCLSVPAESGSTKYLIIASVCAAMFSLMLTGIELVDTFSGQFHLPDVVFVTTVKQALLPDVAMIIFLLFVRGLAKFIHRPKLARRAITILCLPIFALVPFFVGMVLIIPKIFFWAMAGGIRRWPQGDNDFWFGGTLITAALMLILVSHILLLILLYRLANATRNYALSLESAEHGEEDYGYDGEDRESKLLHDREDRYDDE